MRKQFLIVFALVPALLSGGCGGKLAFRRVPPGQSLNVALAQKAIPVEQPPALPPINPNPAGPSAKPDLPESNTEQIADLVTQANICLQTGHPAEAISAYEQVLVLKPDFAEARYNVAVLYQQNGEDKKAAAAFKKFKEIAQQ